MTNEKAIDLLRRMQEPEPYEPQITEETFEALELAIRVLGTDKNVGTKLAIDPYKIERAIRGLTEWQKHVQTESDIDRDISVAVEALKAQLGTNLAEVGTDCISRQKAINALYEWEFDNKDDRDAIDVINGLPPIQPKRGKWIKTARWGRVYYCDQCRNYLDFDGVNAGRGSTNFCPNCGADMRGEQNG